MGNNQDQAYANYQAQILAMDAARKERLAEARAEAARKKNEEDQSLERRLSNLGIHKPDRTASTSDFSKGRTGGQGAAGSFSTTSGGAGGSSSRKPY